ncbi:centrosomal protein POC5-like isoform X2 [Acropora millepora]|uniref:centrosomal protein POC5-like isoform X2 n=1 Tax=Acropora millepora TaxID=45264 RepID=UPI001CF10D24|nr:centrosomal protein POC5-like isoform X2 [Acropora millepora]
MASSLEDSTPHVSDVDSPGSSVSSSLQREYEELLKYAVVTPKIQVRTNVYDQSAPVKDSVNPSTISTETKSSVSSSSSSTSTNSVITRSGESVEVSLLDAKEDVKQLPSTPSLKVSLQGQGSLARDSLLRQETSSAAIKTPEVEHESSSGSPEESPDTPPSASPVIDADLARMEALLDNWCLDLKRNVLAEFAQCKMGLFEKQRQLLLQEKRRHGAELNKLLNEMESQKELLHTYELTLEHKDSIVSNITNAIQKQKERNEMLRAFTLWKLRHCDERRESFASKLARRHYNHVLQSRAWSAWRSVIESRWKQRVEKACQAKAQDVCVKLTEDYENRLQTATRELEVARNEIARLHAERDQYEETMKKAFMRGVCALNLEAMSMFREGEEGGRGPPPPAANPNSGGEIPSDTEDLPRYRPPIPTVTTSGSSDVTQHQSFSHALLRQRCPSGPGQLGGKTLTVKAVCRPDIHAQKGGAGLVGSQGAVSSVLVQKHSSEQSISGVPPVRHSHGQRAPATRSISTKTSRGTAVQTIHTTPVKVVH